MFKESSKGFTLIELLVVIAIIAILAVLIIIRLTSSLRDARDAKRLHAVDQIVTALEMYKIKNGEYPNDDGDHNGWDTSCHPTSDFLPYLVPEFLPEAPVDPIYQDEDYNSYCYRYGRRWPDAYGCDSKTGYVLGIEIIEGSDRPHPQSPGFSCNIDFSSGDPLGTTCLDGAKPCKNFQTSFDWVTGI